jgi:hypothetical protein
MYDYEAEESGELTIVKDQVLYVMTERGGENNFSTRPKTNLCVGWFYGKNDQGNEGLFPSNYVEAVPQ